MFTTQTASVQSHPPGKTESQMRQSTCNEDIRTRTYVHKRNKQQDKRLHRVCQALDCGAEATGRAAARARTPLCNECSLKSEVQLRTNPKKNQRFCQACRNVHPIELFQGKKTSCEAAFERNRIARRKRRGKCSQKRKEEYNDDAQSDNVLYNEDIGSQSSIEMNTSNHKLQKADTMQSSLESDCKTQDDIKAFAQAHHKLSCMELYQTQQ